MSRARLFLLVGLPFSGKSTMSRAMQDRFGIAHVEVDRYVTFDGGEIVWLPAYRTAIDVAKTELSAGRSVVFDAVGHQFKHRKRMRRLAESLDVEMTIVYLDVSEEAARARMLANRATPVRTDVPDAGFAWIAGEMEPPGPDEGALSYRPEEPLAEWLDRAIAPLLIEDAG